MDSLDTRSLKYVVASAILEESAHVLRALSEKVRESVLLWTGIEQNRKARVGNIIVPEQIASRIHFDVPLDERLKITRRLGESHEKLLAQLHTHPGRAFHSPRDDRLALPRHQGAISIVVPNFAASWTGDLMESSVNIHLGRGVWRELSLREVSDVFEVHHGV